MDEETLCECSSCKYCRAHASSEYDYETEEYDCTYCNGAGCAHCEEE